MSYGCEGYPGVGSLIDLWPLRESTVEPVVEWLRNSTRFAVDILEKCTSGCISPEPTWSFCHGCFYDRAAHIDRSIFNLDKHNRNA